MTSSKCRLSCPAPCTAAVAVLLIASTCTASSVVSVPLSSTLVSSLSTSIKDAPVALHSSTASLASSKNLSESATAVRSAVEMLAADITYVTSPATTHALAWWVVFLLVVGLLGAVAACVLPVFYFCKNRSRHAEEAARGAKINKSMQEMTARLYRTRQQQQQYENGFGVSLSSLQQLQQLGVAAAVQRHGGGSDGGGNTRDGRPTSQNRKRTSPPPLLLLLDSDEETEKRVEADTDAIQVATSPLRGRSSTTHTSLRHRAFSGEAGHGEAAVGDSGASTLPPSRQRSTLSRAALQPQSNNGSGQVRGKGNAPHGSVDASPLERQISGHSVASSTSTASLAGQRHTSVGHLAVRSASSRSLLHTSSPGQLTRAPSVRAFAGMNKVEALRRALGRPQLLPVSSVHSSAHLSSPGLKRQQSTFFLDTGAFDEKASSDAYDSGNHVRRDRSGSTNSSEDGTGEDRVERSHSSSLIGGADTVEYAQNASPLMPPLPQPPARPMKFGAAGPAAASSPSPSTATVSAVKDYTFLQPGESIPVTATGVLAKEDKAEDTYNNTTSNAADAKDGSHRGAESPFDSDYDGTLNGEAVMAGRRRTMDRISTEMQRLLLRPSTGSLFYPDAPPVSARVEVEDAVELGDVAAPHIPGVMEDGRLRHLAAPLPLTHATSADDDTDGKREDGGSRRSGEDVNSEDDSDDAEGSGTAASSKSSRFVLARSINGSHAGGAGGGGGGNCGGGTHRVEGRPITVDHQLDRVESDAEPDAAHARATPDAAEGTDGQHLLSQFRFTQLERQRAAPYSSPVRQRQRRNSPVSRLSQSDEYSRLMDSQFQQQL